MTKKRLFDENSFLREASTLSPIPGFNEWLSSVSLTEKLSTSHQQMIAEAIEGINVEATSDSTSKLADILQQDPAKLLLDDTRATKLKEPVRLIYVFYLFVKYNVFLVSAEESDLEFLEKMWEIENNGTYRLKEMRCSHC